MTKRELIAALQFLAIMPRTYRDRGPDWIVREMEGFARLTVLKADTNARYPKGGK